MNKEIIKRIKEIFAEKIATKNSWGKNEIINLHNEAVSEALMEFEKVLTAEEFLETKTLSPSKDMYEGYNIPYSYLESLLVEFARIHVKRAIKSSNLFINGNESGSHSYISDKLKISIYNDYPLTNIK